MTRDKHQEYVHNWKKGNEIFLCNALGLEDSPQYKFLMNIDCSIHIEKSSTFLQEVIQADSAYMSFGKYTLYSVYANTANGNMSALRFAMLFGNKDKDIWTNFWKFIKKTHLIVDQSNKTIITNQDKGSLAAINDIVPLAGRLHCSFDWQQNLVKKCGGRKGHKALTAIWLYNLLCGCKSVALLTATRKSGRIRYTLLPINTSSTVPMKCNSQPQGVLRVIQFACMEYQRLLVWNQ
jgi:hypothetical protein